jgi:hypothetical protein
MLEEQRVHRRVDEVVDRDHLDVWRALEERSQGLAADPAEAVDTHSDCHVSFLVWT